MHAGTTQNKPLYWQFLRFASAGVLGTLAHYVVLVLVVSATDASPIVGTASGATVGALINYWLNYHFTFRSQHRHRRTLPRFLLLATIGIGLNALIVGMLVSQGLHYLLAQLAATAIVLFTNYMVSKLWIFRPTAE